MKKALLTTAILLLGVVAGNAAQRPGDHGTYSDSQAGNASKEDNQGYMSGPHWRHPMVRTNSRPFWHGMRSHRSHHWWEFWQ